MRRLCEFGRHYALKAERLHIQFIDEHINDADRVVLSDIVIEMFRK